MRGAVEHSRIIRLFAHADMYARSRCVGTFDDLIRALLKTEL
jgi:hypothetical protein